MGPHRACETRPGLTRDTADTRWFACGRCAGRGRAGGQMTDYVTPYQPTLRDVSTGAPLVTTMTMGQMFVGMSSLIREQELLVSGA